MDNAAVRRPVDLDLLAEKTYSAVFADACDQLGYRAQTLDPRIVPQTRPGSTLAGWARIAESVGVNNAPERPYGSEIGFLDSLQPGDVITATAGGVPAALWGELFSAAATARGARGAVIDGLIRDADRIRALEFAVHATGRRPTDSLGRVSLIRTEGSVAIGGVPVKNGDLVIADADGGVIIPQEITGPAVELALAKAESERNALGFLQGGSFLAEIWERFKVL